MSESSPAPDLDLRLVRYFTMVAEHRHFGRAAEALHITQPSLSRQIRHFEKQMGARLIDPTPQGSQLTDAGAFFLPRAKALLRSAADGVAQTRAAAEPSRITIGYTTGLIVTPAIRELRHRYPDTDVRTVHLAGSCETRAALLGKRVDALVTRLPFRTDQLHVRVLYDELRVLVVPIGHRLAGKEFVTLDDIADEPLPRMPQGDPVWSAFWHIDPRPDGSPAPDGPLVENVEDKFEVIAAGEALAITAGPRGGTVRPDLTTVPLRGVEPSRVVLATRANDRNRLVAAFRKSAQAHLTGPCPAAPSSVPPTPSLS
jgi:DNA-binding transcriptional LysR family regulator